MKLTRDAFCDLRHKAQQALRRSKETPSVLICAGTGCIAGGALKIYENLKNECRPEARQRRGKEPAHQDERVPRLLRNGPPGPH